MGSKREKRKRRAEKAKETPAPRRTPECWGPDVKRPSPFNRQVVMTCTDEAGTVRTADVFDRAHGEWSDTGGMKSGAKVSGPATPRRYPPWLMVGPVSFETAFELSEAARLHLERSGIQVGRLGSSSIAGMPGAARLVDAMLDRHRAEDAGYAV